MTEPVKERITFEVETTRILGILSSEIYDSPKAFLRENVQNAYDAILMRCTAQELPIAERKVEITVEAGRLTVRDDGIGMTEEVLKDNFWTDGRGPRGPNAVRAGAHNCAEAIRDVPVLSARQGAGQKLARGHEGRCRDVGQRPGLAAQGAEAQGNDDGARGS